MMTVRVLLMMLGIVAFSFTAATAKEAALPFAKGEKITYTIKKMGFSGEATLVFAGKVEVSGQSAYLINFKATGRGLLDEEKIYLDTKSFLPIRVERDVDIKIMRKKERIVEDYDQKKYEVKIVKTTRKGKPEEQTIKKDRPVENLYGFIYRYRVDGKFTIGDTLQMNLPTQDVKLKLTKMDKIKISGKEQEAYYMESDPSKYKVWFDGTDKKVPLRIDGAVGFGSTSMVMKEYNSGKSAK